MRGGPLNEHISFLILNDNPKAKFVYGENEVPIKKGSLVTFDGNVQHRTIIDQGVVNLLDRGERTPNSLLALPIAL